MYEWTYIDWTTSIAYIYVLKRFTWIKFKKEIEKSLNEDIGHPNLFSYNRYVFIKAMISFDDSSTRNQRWERDTFEVFRHVIEAFNKQCAIKISSNEHFAIHEILYPTSQTVGFKTYNKDKM